MKKLLIILALFPFFASAQLTVPQGGTGTTTFQVGTVPFGVSALRLKSDLNFFWDNTSKHLGIGTSTPFSTLSVSSTTQTIGTLPLFTVASTTNSTLLTVLGNGNVGIGTATPSTTLDINGVTTFRGNIIAGTDNSFDIGASGATRPKNIYVGTGINVGPNLQIANNIIDNSGALTIGPSAGGTGRTLTFKAGGTTGGTYTLADAGLLQLPNDTTAITSGIQLGTTGPSYIYRQGSGIIGFSLNGVIVALQKNGSNPELASNTGQLNLLTSGTVVASLVSINSRAAVNVSSFTDTSGSNIVFQVTPTYNQASGSSANTDFLINRTQTNVGSGAQLLADFQVSTVSKFKVDNTGAVTTQGALTLSGSGNLGNIDMQGKLFFHNSSAVSSPTDGTILMANNALTGFTRVILGTNDTSGVAIKKNSTAINFTLGDGTGNANITAGAVTYGAFTIATLPTGVAGMEAYVTDGDGGLAWGATVVNSGTGSTKYLTWYNGTNWTVVGK